MAIKYKARGRPELHKKEAELSFVFPLFKGICDQFCCNLFFRLRVEGKKCALYPMETIKMPITFLFQPLCGYQQKKGESQQGNVEKIDSLEKFPTFSDPTKVIKHKKHCLTAIKIYYL